MVIMQASQTQTWPDRSDRAITQASPVETAIVAPNPLGKSV
jgi:hypothetical protein